MDGIINVYKEQDFTSFDVIAKLRGILKTRKIGHTGTLDPMAEGVLPICVGSATKLCEMLMDHTKEYETVMLLGVITDTQDITGDILSRCEDPARVILQRAGAGVTDSRCADEEKSDGGRVVENDSDGGRVVDIILRDVISSFVGEIEQTPPMYSAKKVNGQKLCDLARAGKTVERKKSLVSIYDIQVMNIDFPRVRMKISCSKGTYIRTLCEDIGNKLGCGACMEKLTRTRVGEYLIKDALKLGEIEKLLESEKLLEHVVAVDEIFKDLPTVVVREELCKLIYNGNVLTREDMQVIDNACYAKLKDGDRVRIYDYLQKFVGVYYLDGQTGRMKPFKMFLN